jgi:hypothetical protein
MTNQSIKKLILPILFVITILVYGSFAEISGAQNAQIADTLTSHGTVTYNPTGLQIIIDSPQNRYYTAPTVSIKLKSKSAESILWNIYNGTHWLYASNRIYDSETEMTLGNGEYRLHVWASKGANQIERTVIFGVNLRNTGAVYATGGSNAEIQSAVNSASEGYAVYLPVGTYVFDSASPLTTVNIPSGISIYGAPALRNSTGQVQEWNTVLTVPWGVPDGNVLFVYGGTSSQLTRFTGIKLLGYREFNSSSVVNRIDGVRIASTAGNSEFRIDHNYLRNLCGYGITVWAGKGVVDHNVMVNYPFYVTETSWDANTVFYGLNIANNRNWDNNTADYLGKYGSRTIFVEDNYFSGWRHSVDGCTGAHIVSRYNVFNTGEGDNDAHDGFSGANTQMGCRVLEIYHNTFNSPLQNDADLTSGVTFRSGGGVVFGNTVTNYGQGIDDNYDRKAFVIFMQLTPDTYPIQQVKDVWIWNNTLVNSDLYDTLFDQTANPVTLNEHFFLRAPSITQDGFIYTPYPYPHPLVD